MMTSTCKELIDSYFKWLKDRMHVEDVDGACEITTPFLDRHNDRLQIYVVAEDTGFRLTDDSYTMADLESSGCAIDTEGRQRMLETILNGFGVEQVGGELTVRCSERDFPQKKHALIQAMLAVNDMFLTARRHVTTLFFEDVQHFLEDEGVRFSPKISLIGRSGYPHNFDFLIPKSRRAPERLIRALNNPTKENGTLALFAWDDTRNVRDPDSQFYVFLNDAETSPNPDLMTALRNYDAAPIAWSQREQFANQLAK